jgi:hypothetical protein
VTRPDPHAAAPIGHAVRRTAAIRVAVIAPQGLRRSGLIEVFARLHPEFVIAPFDSIGDCVRLAARNLDLILYWPGADFRSDISLIMGVRLLRQAFDGVAVAVVA